MFTQTASAAVETLAQRYFALLVKKRKAEAEEPQPDAPLAQQQGASSNVAPDFQEVDINSLELSHPRTVGVEHVGLHALNTLDFNAILEDAGLSRIQRVAAISSVIAHMAQPGSEQASWDWLENSSDLGELLDVDFEAKSVMQLHRASDLLIKNREQVENALFSRVQTLFSLPATVNLVRFDQYLF